jgi:hypothetical protein
MNEKMDLGDYGQEDNQINLGMVSYWHWLCTWLP